MKEMKNAILIFAVFTIFLGIIYPLSSLEYLSLHFLIRQMDNLINENGTDSWF